MDDNLFGQRLRKARRAQDLTQQQLGEKAQVNYTTISRIEKGVSTKIYASTVYDLATALEVSLDWLYGRKEDSHV